MASAREFEGLNESQQQALVCRDYSHREEERVRQHPPPPLWDENVPVKFQKKSFVFTEQMKAVEKALVMDSCPPNKLEVVAPQNTPFAAEVPLPLLLMATLSGDLPLLSALGRFNIDLNWEYTFAGRATTPLLFLLTLEKGGALNSMRIEGTTCSDVVEWLCSRGADVKKTDGSGTAPLSLALRTRPVEMGVCKTLLRFGARAALLSECTDRVARKALQTFAKNLGPSAPPPLLCPCGNDVAVSDCHGSADGVPAHPRMLCMCQSGKRYGKCCQRRRYFWRETLSDAIPPPRPIVNPSAVETIKSYMKLREHELRAEGRSDEEIRSAKLFPKGTSEFMRTAGALRLQRLASEARAAGDLRLDPCSIWCLTHPRNDFLFARPWRVEGVMRLDKEECKKRQADWNAAVDDYISQRSLQSDDRTADEIARLNKVGWAGGALYRVCSNKGCENTEKTGGEFQSCSKCKLMPYCCRDCQKVDWGRHKKECGETHTEPPLPSTAALEEVAAQLMQSLQL